MKTLRYLLLAVLLAAVPSFADTSGDQALGSPVTFSATVVPVNATNLSYQWKKDGVAIAGATAATYRIPAVAVTDAGTYTVVVANKAGSVVSDKGVFTITVGPSGATVSISYS